MASRFRVDRGKASWRWAYDQPMARAWAVALLIVSGAGVLPLEAAEPPPAPGWYSTSGLSYVMAAGNSGASSLGFKAEVKRLWPMAAFTVAGAGVRAEANDPARRAVGSPERFGWTLGRSSTATSSRA